MPSPQTFAGKLTLAVRWAAGLLLGVIAVGWLGVIGGQAVAFVATIEDWMVLMICIWALLAPAIIVALPTGLAALVVMPYRAPRPAPKGNNV